jgi:predicted HTH transcriptional regulator
VPSSDHAKRASSAIAGTEVARCYEYMVRLENGISVKMMPAVYFFEDGLEIISIGDLPEHYSLQGFYLGRSLPVNLELQQIMKQPDFIEQTGHRVPLVVSKYGRHVFDITENFITVTLPLNVSSKPNASETEHKQLTNTQKR